MFFGSGDPFGDMPGGRASRGSSKPTDTSKLYETLGVSKDATQKEIKTAFRKQAVKHHPDKGGDEQKFKEVNAAHEILSDPEKRRRYDKYGLEGVADDSPGHQAEDLFSMFFGQQRRSAGPRRGEDVNHPLQVSLEDLYNSKTVKLAVSRQVLVGEPKKCTTCDGQGVVLELRRLALGMVQQIQRRCSACNGEGYISQKKRERKILEVHVEKGMKNNQKIVFGNMADEKPNMEAGNVNFIIQEKEHALFKRKGADLLITKTLSLNEALCGFEWKITHLDNREVVIKSRPGEVIKAEADNGRPFVKVVPNEGMPSLGNPFVKGNLYVLFQVQFPETGELSQEAVTALRKFLPKPAMEVEYDEDTADVVNLEPADVKNFGKGGIQTSRSAYDEDGDEGPQQVQCQQS